MAIYAQNKAATPYMGYYKPVNLYRGGQKVAGWTWAERQGEAVEFGDTYNDAVHGMISGHSEQAVTVQGKNLFSFDNFSHMSSSPERVDYVYNSPNSVTLVALTSAGNQQIYLTDGSDLANQIAGKWVTLSATFGGSYEGDMRLFLICIDINGTSLYAPSVSYSVTKKAFTVPKGTAEIRPIVRMQHGAAVVSGSSMTVSNIQLELGTVATPYEPFVPDSPSPDYPSPIHSAGGCDLVSADGIKSSSIAMPTLRSLPNAVADTLEYVGGGMWEHVQGVGRIASYSGESITGAYMSTTGALSVGAEVIYELATPIITMLNLGELKSYPHETQIHQDTTGLLADLTLTARVVDKEAE